jgi:hypothetical protein
MILILLIISNRVERILNYCKKNSISNLKKDFTLKIKILILFIYYQSIL